MPANPALQAATPTHPPRWRTLSARDRPLREDTWIASVLNDPNMRSRWDAFIEAPRFVFSEEMAPWSIVVLALHPDQENDDLLARLFAMGSAQQTPAWAVCRYTALGRPVKFHETLSGVSA